MTAAAVSSATPPSEAAAWRDALLENRERWSPVPRRFDLTLDESLRRLVVPSIQTFQLGESSDGEHLLAYARARAEAIGDGALFEAVETLVADEHRHAADLARILEANGVPLLEHQWTDAIFRRLRNFVPSLELSVAVLVTAELIACVYYEALRRATPSSTLAALCERILEDEHLHVAFQGWQLEQLRMGRHPLFRRLTELAHRALFAAAVLIVWHGHRPVLRLGGYDLARFRQETRKIYDRVLSAPSSCATGPGSLLAPSGVSARAVEIERRSR